MGIDRSPDKGAANSSNSCCPICNAEVNAAEVYVTACQHEFHRKCIEVHWKKRLQCPVCRPKGLKVTDDPERRTRSQSRNQPTPDNVGRQTTDDIATTSGSIPICSN
ncbi:E3 ubiquitin-protein ligase RNF181 homolog [Drosophila eugracilis]|uniref:E3 ubiquitin-protein ligase RNF181 homolog n=1 Tax=Drosophila eugracilis TaxID=29029 RepID=UPI001BDA185F|nr:E3 ubiquitin-protein ligase RNF181 homolog [Drosophila eugracilis]